MDSNILVKDLSVVREYFSHNMRTATAMVVATVSIFKFGLDDDTENLSNMIIESSYFLDIYDKGMEVLFNYILGKPLRSEKDEIDPVKITARLIEDLQCSIKEQGLNVECYFDDMTISETNSYIVKTLLELILCEEIKKSEAGIEIKTGDKTFSIRKAAPTDNPEIYDIYVKLLSDLNIEFKYTKDNLTLKFK